MTDYQLELLFTNMSTQTAKVVASNADLSGVVIWGASALFAGLLVVMFATTWRG